MGRFSKRSLEGEILIDHKSGPGLPEEVARFIGVDPQYVRSGATYESAIVTCSHCQVSVLMNPERTRERGWCSYCDKYLCDECTFILSRTRECRNVQRVFDTLDDLIAKHGESAVENPLINPFLFPQTRED